MNLRSVERSTFGALSVVTWIRHLCKNISQHEADFSLRSRWKLADGWAGHSQADQRALARMVAGLVFIALAVKRFTMRR